MLLNFHVHINHMEIFYKCGFGFRRSGVGPTVSVPSKLQSDAHAVVSGTTWGGEGVTELTVYRLPG